MPENVNTAAAAEPQAATPDTGGLRVIKTVTTGRQPEPPATPDPVVAAPPDPVEEYRKTIGQKAGLDLKSDDEIVERLTKFTTYEQELTALKNRNPYEGLNPLAVDLDKATKAGIDINLYWEARQMDPDKMDARETLRKAYLLKNTVPGVDTTVLNRRFERDFNTKYGIIDRKLDETELESSRELIEAAKDDLATDTAIEKRYLQEWKQKNVTIPEATRTGPSEQELSQKRDEYLNRVDSFVDGSDTLEIPVGDKVFKYGLDEHKDDIRDALKNPVKALKDILGVDVNTGNVDEQKFGAAIAALLSYGSLGQKLAEFGVEQFNHQAVTQRIQTPAPPQQQIGGVIPELTHNQKLGLAFTDWRESRRRAG
jgi:hypothetical protein